jgi:hypothetical protein
MLLWYIQCVCIYMMRWMFYSINVQFLYVWCMYVCIYVCFIDFNIYLSCTVSRSYLYEESCTMRWIYLNLSSPTGCIRSPHYSLLLSMNTVVLSIVYVRRQYCHVEVAMRTVLVTHGSWDMYVVLTCNRLCDSVIANAATKTG